MSNITYLLILFLYGTVFGSFASVVVWRLFTKTPGMMSGRSKCPKCEHKLGTAELVPLLSFLFLKGKCKNCKSPISALYPMIELLMGVLFAMTGHFFSVPDLISSGDMSSILRLGFFLILAFVTVIYVMYDILFTEIPDEVVIPAILGIFGLLVMDSFFLKTPFFSHFLSFDTYYSILNIPIVNALLGSITIFLFFLLQIWLSDGKWMGGGDLRLAVLMGLMGGFKIAILGLFLAYISGSVIGIFLLFINRIKRTKGGTEMPFGPYLALGLYISLFFHEPILHMIFG